MSKKRLVNLDDNTLAPKKQWRVNCCQPPAADITKKSVGLDCCCPRNFGFFYRCGDRVLTNPPVDDDDPLL